MRLWVEMYLLSIQKLSPPVSLLVRLWVEIQEYALSQGITTVSLLVRLWVEMSLHGKSFPSKLSASLWGCELKLEYIHVHVAADTGQPPCEAVSWNDISVLFLFFDSVSLLVRLWVEMHDKPKLSESQGSQPPCEAVSWNAKAITKAQNDNVSLLVRLWVEMMN